MDVNLHLGLQPKRFCQEFVTFKFVSAVVVSVAFSIAAYVWKYMEFAS